MAFREISPPPIDSTCPNVVAVALVENAAHQLGDDIAYYGDNRQNSGGGMHSEVGRGTLAAGTVGVTVARLAMERLCEGCEVASGDDCPRQADADKILGITEKFFTGNVAAAPKVTVTPAVEVKLTLSADTK